MYDYNLSGLVAATKTLREDLLRQAAAAAHFDLNEATLPKARAAVDSVLEKFLFAPDAEAMRELAANDAGSRKIIDQLRMTSIAELANLAPAKNRKVRNFKGQAQRQRPDARRNNVVRLTPQLIAQGLARPAGRHLDTPPLPEDRGRRHAERMVAFLEGGAHQWSKEHAYGRVES